MDLSNTNKEVKALAQYTSMLASLRIWIQREKYLADTIPCMLLASSIPRDINALIMEELQITYAWWTLLRKMHPFVYHGAVSRPPPIASRRWPNVSLRILWVPRP